MRNLKIVFMGTPEFAVSILDGILKEGYEVAGVVTAPDRPAGRGRKLQESAVKQYAVKAGLRVLQPANLKSPQFLEELKELNPNVQVVVAFRMLPKVVWNYPEYGTFNLHASLLPDYRGAAPINWALINGEATTGVTTFFLDEKIDTGAIIAQLIVPIEPDENAGQLHDKLMDTGTKLVLATLEQIRMKTVKTVQQEEMKPIKEAPKLTRENTRINWNEPAIDIFNFIRGLNPYPGAWCYLDEGSGKLAVKIYEAIPVEETHQLPVGTLIQIKEKLKVAVQGGFLEINEIQLPGKRKMKTGDLLNGYQFEKVANLL